MKRHLTGWSALVAWFIGSAVWLAGAGPVVIGHADQPAAVIGPRFESVQPYVFGVSGGQPNCWADFNNDGNLDLFVGANLARRVESANAYVANAHPDCLHDCIFLICDSCGQTTHIDDDRLSNGVRAAARQAGFAPDRPVIEVRGRCSDCESA